MNLNAIHDIYKFNKDAGLLNSTYDALLEKSMIVEEALEPLDFTELANVFDIPGASPKTMARRIIGLTKPADVQPVDRLDSAIDQLVLSFGECFKQGLSVTETMNALQIVATANLTKLSVGTDEQGKQMKPTNFIPPEEQLQVILDNIKK